jgi:predicted HTH domain antitoxin
LRVIFTVRVEEDLAKLIDEVSVVEGVSRSAVIRRLLVRAAKEYRVEKSLTDYAEGKVTLWQAARRCSMSIWEMTVEAKKREIHVPYDLEEFREDLKGLRNGA